MKKFLLFFLVAICASGCGRVPGKKTILAKINNYEITQDEFEAEFKESGFSRIDTPESKREFLDNLINRKLILQEAQLKGLDKDENFLKMIERFWEQSLLKLALDRKSKELTGKVFVSDKAIEEAYQNMVKEGRTEKPYEAMYHQIKWEITQAKESQLMNEWVAGLEKEAHIRVNYSLLDSR